jgi:REP element-mobilizing transposase RayT
MARRPRISFKGAVYHVCFRGNARQRIFIDNRDRHRFLVSLAERIRDYQIRLYLYCLMVNHVHLLLETPCANISAFMESLLASFAVYFNLRHQCYVSMTKERSVRSEDVAFRRIQERVPAPLILDRVCSFFGITLAQLRAHRKRDRFKPIAAWLLTKLGGLTQREVATLLGLETGAAVCLQLKRLKENPPPSLTEDLDKLEKQIQVATLNI